MTPDLTSRAAAVAAARALVAAGGLRAVRTRAGLSQPDLARLVDVDASTVSRWEDGTRTPNGRTLGRLADVLAGLPA